MKRFFIFALFLVSVTLVGCSKPEADTVGGTPEPQDVQTGNTLSWGADLPKHDMTLPSEAKLYYVVLEWAWSGGDKIGCDDTLISVPTVLDSLFTSREEVLTLVYKMQLGEKAKPDYATTAVTTTLALDKVLVKNGKAALAFSGSLDVGGACDAPRIKAQLTAPALQFPEIDDVIITINGQKLDEYLSVK